MRVARLLVPLTVLAVLAGCADGADEADADAPEPTPVADTAEQGRIKVLSPDADLAACLQGTWDVASESAEASAVAGMGYQGEVLDASAAVTGSQTVTFEPGTLTTRYEDQVVTITGTFDTMAVELITRFNGETVQGYVLDGDVLTVGGTDFSGVTVESRTFVDGEELSIPEYEAQLVAAMTFAAAAGYTDRIACSDTSLRQTPVIAGTTLPELAVTMTRH